MRWSTAPTVLKSHVVKKMAPRRLGRGSIIEALEDRRYCSDTAGNTPATARDLGITSNATLTVTEQVGSTDHDDFYKFAVPAAGNMTLNLGSLTSNADLQLFNSTGATLLGLSSHTGTTAEKIVKSLSVGTYIARVKWIGPSTANYQLAFTGAAGANPGASAATAKNLGNIGTAVNVTFNNSVNKSSNTTDFYKITTSGKGLLTIHATNVIGSGLDTGFSNVSIGLYASNGTTLLATRGPTTSPGTNVLFHGTVAATYYIKIFGSIVSTTNYQLAVSNPAVPADTAGNTRATATAGGPSSAGFIVNTFNQDDWFKKTYAGGQAYDFIIKGMTANLRFTIVNSAGSVIATSNIDPDFEEASFFTMTTGVFYVHVFQAVPGANGVASPYYFLGGL